MASSSWEKCTYCKREHSDWEPCWDFSTPESSNGLTFEQLIKSLYIGKEFGEKELLQHKVNLAEMVIPKEMVILEEIVAEEVVADSKEVDVAPEEVDPTIVDMIHEYGDRYISELALFADGSKNIVVLLPEVVGAVHSGNTLDLDIQEGEVRHAWHEAPLVGYGRIFEQNLGQEVPTIYDCSSVDMYAGRICLLHHFHDMKTHDVNTYNVTTPDAYIVDDFDYKEVKSSDGRESGRKRARKGYMRMITVPGDNKRAGYLRNPVNAARLKPFVDGEVLE